MSEEELEFKLKDNPDEGFRTFAKECRKLGSACKRLIFRKSDKSRKKAIALYPELEGCPLDCRNPDCFEEFVHTRGNMSPRMSKIISFWPILTIVLCSK